MYLVFKQPKFLMWHTNQNLGQAIYQLQKLHPVTMYLEYDKGEKNQTYTFISINLPKQ